MKGHRLLKKQTDSLKILFTSDIHGTALPKLYGTNEKANIGLVKYTTIVKQYREKYKNVLVLDNGDLIQGTPLMTHYMKKHRDKPNPMIDLMNHIELDAAVFGNHEFNYGLQTLEAAVHQSNFPWLSANILDEKSKKPYFGKPYIIKQLSSGLKVAIVGVTTHYIPNWESPQHIEGLHFADSFDTLKKWVEYIRETKQPDLLIALYHGGFERDLETGEPTETLTGENQGYKICQEIEGIDILLTGHQHRKLVEKVHDVLVLQPGKDLTVYGEVDVHFQKLDSEWKIEEKRAHLRDLSKRKSDEHAVKLVEDLEASTQKWLDEPLGTIEGNMEITDPFQVRLEKHPFIQFVQQVQMDATGADISTTALFNNDMKGFTKHVTMREVVSNYMYPNTLVVLELTKDDIIAALEKSAEYFSLNEHGEIIVNPSFVSPKVRHYDYDMWEGIEYSINVSKPVGNRVERVTYQGKPLQASETYHVVLSNYRANGAGGFDMYKNKPIVQEVQVEMTELIRAYFENNPVVRAKYTKNFTITS